MKIKKQNFFILGVFEKNKTEKLKKVETMTLFLLETWKNTKNSDVEIENWKKKTKHVETRLWKIKTKNFQKNEENKKAVTFSAIESIRSI